MKGWTNLNDRLEELGCEVSICYQGKYDGRRQTYAKITHTETGYSWRSHAYCSFKDVYNKKLGRLVALGRAYKIMVESKEYNFGSKK